MILTDAQIKDCIKFFKKFENVFQIDKATFVQADEKMQNVLWNAFETADQIDPLSSEERDQRESKIARGYEFKRTIIGGKFPIVGLNRWIWTGFYYRTITGKRTYSYSRNNFYAKTNKSGADPIGFVFDTFYNKSLYKMKWRLNRERFWKDYLNELEIANFGTIFDFVDNNDLISIESIFTTSIQNKIDAYLS